MKGDPQIIEALNRGLTVEWSDGASSYYSIESSTGFMQLMSAHSQTHSEKRWFGELSCAFSRSLRSRARLFFRCTIPVTRLTLSWTNG